MKIAVFTEFFEDDKNSAGRHMSDIVRELGTKFDEIDVYSIYKHKTTKDKNKWPKNINIYDLGMKLDAKSNSYFIRFFVELSISFRALIKILKLKKFTNYDGIVWYSPTIFWGPIVLILSIFKNTKKYLILRDIFPQWAIDLEVIKKYSFQSFILLFFEKLQYKIADIIAIQTEGNISYFESSQNLKNKTVILRTWYDVTDDVFALPEELIKKIPLHKKLLVYVGNLGIAQDQKIILNLIKEMKPFNEFHFLLIGQKDSDKKSILKIRHRDKLENLTVLNSIDKKYVDSICSMSYIGIFSLDKRHTTHNIPGKFLQYISCGLPVFGICSKSDITEIIKENDLGETYSGNSSAEAMYLLKNLSQNIEEKKIKPENLRSYIRDNISTKNAAKKIYNDLIKN